jgi:hypothetical protein
MKKYIENIEFKYSVKSIQLSPNIFLRGSLLPDPVITLNISFLLCNLKILTLHSELPKNSATGYNRVEIRKINHK